MKALAALVLLFGLQDPSEEKVRDLVARCGSDNVDTREEAQRALVAMGEAVLPLLRKLEPAQKDAEIAGRVRAAIRQIEEHVARNKVYRPARPVTLRPGEVALKDAVRSAGVQAGVEVEVAAAVADRKVSLEAEREPVLKVLDRLCAAQGDISLEVTEGKLRIKQEKFVPYPAAYADGFRARLKRVSTQHQNDFAAPSTTVILHFAFDAQPDIRPKSACCLDAPRSGSGAAELSFKPVTQGRLMGSSSSGDRGTVTVDGVTVPFDSETPVDGACFLKDGPGGLRRLETLRVRARYRFATGLRPVSCKLAMKGDLVVEGLPVRVTFMGSHLQLMHTSGYGMRLDDLIDMESVTVVGKGGREEKATSLQRIGGLPYPGYCTFRVNAENVTDPELRFSAFDGVFEKEVEFELKDVVLRD